MRGRRTLPLVMVVGLVVSGAVAGPAVAAGSPGPAGAAAARPGCRLANGIKHVIDVQFDNVHLTRDNPRVPSDLEQMPHLLGFLEHNGTVLGNAHDVLSHTATNFSSNQTGLYEDRTSMTQSNSFSYYDSAGVTHPGVSFAYWTDPLFDPTGKPADTKFNMDYSVDRALNPTTTNVDAPAPWATYTKAGCDVGEVGMANTVLENIQTDIPTVFGAGSPQAAEAAANPAKATADFVGIAVHCGRTSRLCAHGQADTLPDEPGGYRGFRALFGNAEAQPAISPSGPVASLSGAVVRDSHGNNGFPGFDGLTPDVSLGYAADMLEHGVQATNVYVSDVHSDHTAADTGDLGPGEKLYEQQLKDYDTAFGSFLNRLRRDGITPANTLFAVTTDEGDHFSGSAPSPAGCTGAPGNYCTYATRSEVNVNLPGLLATQAGNTTRFAIHPDPAPALWLAGNPARTAPAARQLARDMGRLSVANPLTGGTDKVATYLADPVEEKILHFVGPDAARTPTLTAFSGEDEFVAGGSPNCAKPCVSTPGRFAWNHGGIHPDMNTIWMALAGPGVRARGIDRSTWTDQVDTRPTILALAGLRDRYTGDGRVLIEDLSPSSLPSSLRGDRRDLIRLDAAYKQITAADGRFAVLTLARSTRALTSGSATDDALYSSIEKRLAALGSRRDAIATRIASVLTGAAFHNHPADPRLVRSLIAQAQHLLNDAR